MPARLRPVPPRLDIDRVLELLRLTAGELGIEAYLVGGFVRDRLLGREGKDIDLVVVGGSGLRLLEEVAAKLGWPRPAVFERFGTAQVRGGDIVVEVVQARAERYDPGVAQARRPARKPGGRHPAARLHRQRPGAEPGRAGPRPDRTRARRPPRRCPPHSAGPGGHLLRRPPPGCSAPPGSLRSSASASPAASPRRCGPWPTVPPSSRPSGFATVCRLLVSPHPREGMDTLLDTGLIGVAIPELLPMVGLEQGGWHLYDVWGHTVRAVELAPPDLVTRLGCLFHDAGKLETHAIAPDGRHTFYDHPRCGAGMAQAVITRLRLSTDEISLPRSSLVLHHMWPILPPRPGRRRGGAALHPHDRSAAVAAPGGGPCRHRASAFEDVGAIDELEERMARLELLDNRVTRLKPPLGGRELMRMAGRTAVRGWARRSGLWWRQS